MNANDNSNENSNENAKNHKNETVTILAVCIIGIILLYFGFFHPFWIIAGIVLLIFSYIYAQVRDL